MDFIIGFLRTYRKHDSIMVVVEKLTKVSIFILMKSTYSVSDVAHIFIREIMRLHGVPNKIMLDIDVKFTSRFWKDLILGLGIDLAFNMTYHPQIGGQRERVNGILEDMSRMYVMH